MKFLFLNISFGIIVLFFLSCGTSKNESSNLKSPLKYLALGDSYTVGESVCDTCNFPSQLKDSLELNLHKTISLKTIAKTGWTTSDLLSAIASKNVMQDYNLVTLLIGVNNQYQDKAFSVYEKEFPQLLDLAIKFGKGNPENVIVLSIPDYAFTSFGKKSGKAEKISRDLIKYNEFAEKASLEKGVRFINITPITQQGMRNPKLVASDGLHPSGLAYRKFIEQIFPHIKNLSMDESEIKGN